MPVWRMSSILYCNFIHKVLNIFLTNLNYIKTFILRIWKTYYLVRRRGETYIEKTPHLTRSSSHGSLFMFVVVMEPYVRSLIVDL